MTVDELIEELQQLKKTGTPGYFNVVLEEDSGFGLYRFAKEVRVVDGKPTGAWSGKLRDEGEETDETLKVVGIR